MNVGGKHGKKSNTDFPTAAFRLGYIYRDIETRLNAFGAETGDQITVADAARWVGTLLLAKAGGRVLDRAEYLSSLRGAAAEGNEVGIATSPLHVRTRKQQAPVGRRLSAKARAAISRAQKERWRIQKAAKAKPKNSKKASGIKKYWAAMTAAERAGEMRRRAAVREAKKQAA